MSVLIKGLKLPKDKAIKVTIRGNDGIASVYIEDGKSDYYTVIKLHNHGDLIDRDELMKRLRDYACKPCREYGADKNGDRCEWCSFDDAFARIEKSKRVIEAERGEE